MVQGGRRTGRRDAQRGRAGPVRRVEGRETVRARIATRGGGKRVGRRRHGRVLASVMQKLKGKEAHE